VDISLQHTERAYRRDARRARRLTPRPPVANYGHSLDPGEVRRIDTPDHVR
jgi:hypothetical protein